MLGLALTLVLGVAQPVALLDEPGLRQLPKAELRTHLHDLEDEIDSLRALLQKSLWDVEGEAASRIGPFVLVTGLPTLGLALLVGNSVLPNSAFSTGLFIAAAALIVGVVAGLVYLIGRALEHFWFDVPEAAARERTLIDYHARVEAEQARREHQDVPVRE